MQTSTKIPVPASAAVPDRIDQALDEALAQSFPASDPIALTVAPER